MRKNRLFLEKIRDLHLDKLTDKATVLIFYNGICFDRLDEPMEEPCCAEFFVHEEDFIEDVMKHICVYGNQEVVEKAQALWETKGRVEFSLLAASTSQASFLPSMRG